MKTKLIISAAQTNETAPLYVEFGGQSAPQRAYLEIDPADGECRFDVSHEIGNGIRQSVWSGAILEIDVAPTLRGDRLQAAYERVEELLDAVCAGWEETWTNGVNRGGRLITAEASDALHEAEEILARMTDEGWSVQVYDPTDWLEGCIDITATTTDEQLDALAAQYEKDAVDDHVMFDGDLREAMGRYRDRRQAA